MSDCPRLAVLLFATLLILPGTTPKTRAQSNDELNGSFQFNFHPPGARSLALGRAFTGRADDATAAYANPAGLLYLSLPEVAIEGRYSSYKTLYVDGGRADGTATGLGIDTNEGPIFSSSEESKGSLSFLSFVYPLGKHDRWRLALYRHELSNFRARIDQSQGVFFELRRQVPGRINHGRVSPVDAQLDLRLSHIGVSSAYRLADRFWVGLGVSQFSYRLQAIWEGFSQQLIASNGERQLSFDEAVFSAEQSGGTRTHEGSDHDIAIVAGILWRNKADSWVFGASYRQAPKLDFEVTTRRRELPDPPCGQYAQPNAIVPCGDVVDELSGSGTFHPPDVLSFGISYRPSSLWTLSFAVDHVTYSNLAPSINVLGIAQREEVSLSEFRIEDGIEYHFGIERDFSVRDGSAIYLRVGGWLDPNHQLEFDDSPPLSTTVVDGIVKPTNDTVRLNARFPGGEDEWHFTAGLGVDFEFLRHNLLIDFGVDSSERESIASLSAVIRFDQR